MCDNVSSQGLLSLAHHRTLIYSPDWLGEVTGELYIAWDWQMTWYSLMILGLVANAFSSSSWNLGLAAI